MKRRRVFWVRARGDAWVVLEDGNVVREWTRKSDAMASARSLAKNAEPSQVKVCTREGKILLEWTYGADPTRTAG